ncbi:MAG: hypothetical protein AAGK04_11420 [Planctomycetota bacterium]
MGSVKPWQVLLFVAAIASLAYAAWNALSGEKVELAQTINLVDVHTGELFEVDVSRRGMVIPAKHPETGERTLLGVRLEDGEWRLNAKGIESLKQIRGSHDAVGNKGAGVVNVINPESPTLYQR